MIVYRNVTDSKKMSVLSGVPHRHQMFLIRMVILSQSLKKNCFRISCLIICKSLMKLPCKGINLLVDLFRSLYKGWFIMLRWLCTYATRSTACAPTASRSISRPLAIAIILFLVFIFFFFSFFWGGAFLSINQWCVPFSANKSMIPT